MRLLVKCPNCSQKYDATKRKIGSRFRCRCGKVVQIVEPQAHEAAVIHCSACGASREAGERACKYCGSDFTIHELDLNTVCPGCLARVSDKARFCHHCATPLSVESVAGEEQPFLCPACEDRQLVSRRLESIATSALECQVCAGLWIGLESFHDLLNLESHGSRGESVSHRRPASSAYSAESGTTKRYRPCPLCRQLMMPRHIAKGRSGIILDICGEHGLWFDCDELSHLIAWMRNGGLEAVKDDVGRLKGSPDTIRKRLSKEGEPKNIPPPVMGESGPFVSWTERTENSSEVITGTELLTEIGAPLLKAARQVVADLFGHRH
jgi:Zn-finger nucleic acid-binding protein